MAVAEAETTEVATDLMTEVAAVVAIGDAALPLPANRHRTVRAVAVAAAAVTKAAAEEMIGREDRHLPSSNHSSRGRGRGSSRGSSRANTVAEAAGNLLPFMTALSPH